MPDSAPTPTAPLVEIFSSVQGEGLLVGVRQLFVRFYGCHLQCRYCDTPESVTARQPEGYKPGHFRLEADPGSHRFEQQLNPVSPEDLLAILLELDQPRGLHHSVALTGGEPLMHTPFLESFLPLLRKNGLRSYLETSGDLFKPFARIHELLD